jgi:hypothetical protein
MGQAAGREYASFKTLESVKADQVGAVILEGDDGGQIYVVVPAHQVLCSEDALDQLLRDLDAINWPGNDDDMARVVYARRPIGMPVAGGMGGAVVGAEAWIHPAMEPLGISEEIRAVISGQLMRLSAENRAMRRP